MYFYTNKYNSCGTKLISFQRDRQRQFLVLFFLSLIFSIFNFADEQKSEN